MPDLSRIALRRWLAAVLAGLTCVAVCAMPSPRNRRSAEPVCSVDLYGDSIMHGGYRGYLRLDEPPAATLKRLRPKYTVHDVSLNGETAAQRARTFESEQRSGHFVIIAHGINDAMQRLPVEASLRQMIEIARREGREVILTGLSRQPVPIAGRASADQTMRRLASELSVPFADWDAVKYSPKEMADVLHPAKQYSDRLVQSIVKVLDRLAPECV